MAQRTALPTGHRKSNAFHVAHRWSCRWRMAITSRMNREIHVRFCGRLEGKSLRPTRQPSAPFERSRFRQFEASSHKAAQMPLPSSLIQHPSLIQHRALQRVLDTSPSQHECAENPNPALTVVRLAEDEQVGHPMRLGMLEELIELREDLLGAGIADPAAFVQLGDPLIARHGSSSTSNGLIAARLIV